ncbi:hypothetical protein ACFJGW_16030 [Burkholderiaceae bacterium UC74_6]
MAAKLLPGPSSEVQFLKDSSSCCANRKASLRCRARSALRMKVACTPPRATMTNVLAGLLRIAAHLIGHGAQLLPLLRFSYRGQRFVQRGGVPATAKVTAMPTRGDAGLPARGAGGAESAAGGLGHEAFREVLERTVESRFRQSSTRRWVKGETCR